MNITQNMLQKINIGIKQERLLITLQKMNLNMQIQTMMKMMTKKKYNK